MSGELRSVRGGLAMAMLAKWERLGFFYPRTLP